MKEVQDRVVQFSNRYKLTNAETGEVLGTFDFDEVTGTVQQVGTEIDAELFQSIADDLAARVVSAGGELAGTIVTFSDISGTAENVASGEKSSTLWGKVKNWFSRLKALAFKSKIAAGDIEAGAISDADISTSAEISQDKISGLKNDYAASIEITGRTVILKNKNGEEIGRGTTQDTTYGNATTEQSGLMSAEDKKNLDGLKSDFGAFKEDQTQTNAENEEKFSGIDTEFEKVNSELEKVNSNFVESETQTDAFIHGENTLAGAGVSVEVRSKNLANEDALISSGLFERTTFQGRNCLKFIAANYVDATITLPSAPNICGVNWAIDADSTNPQVSILQLNQTYQDGTQKTNYIGQNEKAINTWYENDQAGLPYLNLTSLAIQATENMPSGGGIYIQITANLDDELSDYTPYLSDGTSVNVTACGGNLFDLNANPEVGTASVIARADDSITIKQPDANGNWRFAGFLLPNTIVGKTITLSGTWTASGNNVACMRVLWFNDVGVGKGAASCETFVSGQSATGVVIPPPEDTTKLYLCLYTNTEATGVTAGDTVTYTNVQLEIGEIATDFEPYESQNYSSQVGQTAYVTQYDKVTNIFATTEGGAVSTKFIKSIKDELNTKVVSLSGNFSKRPTGTYPYVILYTATNKFDEDRFTRLEANTDGSVSANWVSIGSGGSGGGIIALQCNAIQQTGAAPSVGGSIANIPFTAFNRTPTAGDGCLVISSNGGNTYACTGEITGVTENAANFEIVSFQKINGDKGDTGAIGPQGEPGAAGAAAGFGTPTANVTPLAAGAAPTVQVSASGVDTAKVFNFQFGIPKGDKGETGSPYLYCATISTPATPYVGETAKIGAGNFNRTPVLNEKFFAIWVDTANNNHTYIVSMEVASGESPYTCNIIGVSDTVGTSGAAAGFGTPTASATKLAASAQPTVSVTSSGADTAKVFNFAFGIPSGDVLPTKLYNGTPFYIGVDSSRVLVEGGIDLGVSIVGKTLLVEIGTSNSTSADNIYVYQQFLVKFIPANSASTNNVSICVFSLNDWSNYVAINLGVDGDAPTKLTGGAFRQTQAQAGQEDSPATPLNKFITAVWDVTEIFN